MNTPNLYNTHGDITKGQDVFQAFNAFMLSQDRHVFNKLVSKIHFYTQASQLPGDIVECGVFKGTGMFSWLKLLSLYEPISVKKVIGFDWFGEGVLDVTKDPTERDALAQVFNRSPHDPVELKEEYINNLLVAAGFPEDKYDLVGGDICSSAYDFVDSRPGFRISILNLDLDLEEPTIHALNALWDRVVPGGVVIFDEYAYHLWTESNAVDEFFREKGEVIRSTPMRAPSAFIIKGS